MTSEVNRCASKAGTTLKQKISINKNENLNDMKNRFFDIKNRYQLQLMKCQEQILSLKNQILQKDQIIEKFQIQIIDLRKSQKSEKDQTRQIKEI